MATDPSLTENNGDNTGKPLSTETDSNKFSIENSTASNSIGSVPPTPPFTSNATIWIGLIGSVITILLTIYTTSNKTRLDTLETSLKERTTRIEESKERVERYKWVQSLYEDLNNKDVKKRNFTIGLMTLALNDTELKKLSSAFQSSNDTSLQSIGQSTLRTLGNDHIVELVSKFNTANESERKDAVGELEKNYKASPVAISLVLNLYNPDNIKTLSSDGIINGLYYLNMTDPKVWSNQLVQQGNDVIKRIVTLNPGPNTSKQLNNFKTLLITASAGK